MSTTRQRIVLALSAAVILAVLPRAQEPDPNSQLAVETANDQIDTQAAAQDETPDLWFVELASPPAADGSSLSQVRKEKADFRAAAAAAKLAYTERYAFDTLWNGLSVRVARRDVGTLSRLDGVKAIYPVQTVTLAEDRPGNEADLFTAIQMTGADIVQNALGYTGAGVRVAIMDTGIDYTHPDLGGCFGSGCRVELGYDLVGDAFTGSSSTPVPDPDPMDCAGHGTHVAGIVGAKAAVPGGVTGVAPGVTFHAYRVFGCEGSTSSDIMIAAMERLLADGADVLNMSIGSTFGWPQTPTAAAATRLVNKGVSVVASAGNDGSLGLYATSAPAVGDKVIAAASFDNTGVRERYFTVTPDGLAIGYMDSDSPALPPTSGSQPLKRTGTSTSTSDACAALPPGSLTGFVALIRRGTCGFYQKAINAQNAGAVGVVIYNNVAGFISVTVAGTPPLAIPVVTITAADGVTLDNRLAAGPVTMTWTNQMFSFPDPTAGLISSFSSYGLSPDLAIKPDIGAPGGFVFSTWPMAYGGYATFSGTSMASPHVAGAVALLLQAHPHTPAQAIRSILQNSAVPAPWSGNPSLGFLDVVHRQGAGMLRIDRAILATTNVDPGKLSLGEGAAGPAVRTLSISNQGDTDVTYDLRHAPALTTGPNTFTVQFLNAPALVTFSAPSVTVPSGGQATVDVIVTPPTTSNRYLYGGYIEFAPEAGGQVVRVPYAGFTGDYQSIQVMTPTPNQFPWLARLVGTSLRKQTSGASYTLQGSDVPYLLMHLDHESRLLRLSVQDSNGKDWHRAEQIDYMPRNSAATSFFAFIWDGTTSAGKKSYTVPNGQYTVTITVVKALGDESNPSDVETWTSPLFTIARP
jgi:minor extracellular serine protease Vpr